MFRSVLLVLVILTTGCATSRNDKFPPAEREVFVEADVPPADIKATKITVRVSAKF